jgi:hypothetical protein
VRWVKSLYGLINHQSERHHWTWLPTGSFCETRLPLGALPIHTHNRCLGAHDAGP